MSKELPISPFTLAFALFVAALPAAPASAQIRLVPDAAAHRLLGPVRSEGVVIWSHGRSVDAEDSRAPTPPYIEDFRQRRWDVFRLNRMRHNDTLAAGAAALAQAARHFKKQGYRRVVLAGQSFGAFISLMAADASDNVDAVIATAPAAYGPVNGPNAHYRLNALRLYPLLAELRHARTILFYFQEDAFDPGGRGPRSEAILRESRTPHLVVDRPPQFSTHWAASTPEFAAAFAGCITDFVAGKSAPSPCEVMPRGNKAHAAIAAASEASPRSVEAGAALQGSSGAQASAMAASH